VLSMAQTNSEEHVSVARAWHVFIRARVRACVCVCARVCACVLGGGGGQECQRGCLPPSAIRAQQMRWTNLLYYEHVQSVQRQQRRSGGRSSDGQQGMWDKQVVEDVSDVVAGSGNVAAQAAVNAHGQKELLSSETVVDNCCS
jgi:hypothetical protein